MLELGEVPLRQLLHISHAIITYIPTPLPIANFYILGHTAFLTTLTEAILLHPPLSPMYLRSAG